MSHASWLPQAAGAKIAQPYPGLFSLVIRFLKKCYGSTVLSSKLIQSTSSEGNLATSLKVPLNHLALGRRQRLVSALSRPANLPDNVRAADARVDELRVAVGRVVDDGDTDAEDGDVQLPLDALVLPAR